MSRNIRNIILIIAFIASVGVFDALCAEDAPFVVVIDPGHGGKDSGCEGKIINEKTIVLDVARKLNDMITDSFPDVKVVMTRSDNRYITLQDRANIANNANGNLFISIHVNSVDRRNPNRKSICGASVYTLGLHKSENNLSVAMRENSVMELEDDYSQAYQGFDPKSAESYIIFELNQNNHINQSIEFANAIQQELITTAGRADKGVRQDGFWVLWATSMPSVLVELDFICNPEIEEFLADEDGRDMLAQSLFNAFSQYYCRHCHDSHGPRVGKPVPRDIITAANKDSDAKPVKKASTKKSTGTTYHVQILSARKQIPAGDSEIKGVPDVNFFQDGKFYKYYSGSFKTQAEAKKRLADLKKRFPKAYIITLRDGKLQK